MLIENQILNLLYNETKEHDRIKETYARRKQVAYLLHDIVQSTKTYLVLSIWAIPA
jgi:hypothetical protein